MLSKKIYKSFDDELSSHWNGLIKLSPHTIYQLYEINKIWYNTIGIKQKGSELIVYVFFESDNVVAIAPLMIRTKFNLVKELIFLGEGIFDYLMIIQSNFNTDNLFDYIFNTIKSELNIDLISMSNIPNFLNKVNDNYKYHLNLHSTNTVLMLDLPDSYEYFFNNLKSSIRGDSRRQIKKISEYGNLKYNIIKGDQKKSFIEELILYKRIRYNKTNVNDIFNDTSYIDFFEDLVFSQNFKFLHCSTLSINERSISLHLGFIYQDKYYYFFPSFDQDNWGKYSPSRLHMLRIINSAISNKLLLFDFTVGNENYKKYFSNKSYEICSYNLGISKFGKLYLLMIGFFKQLMKPINNIKFLKRILLGIR